MRVLESIFKPLEAKDLKARKVPPTPLRSALGFLSALRQIFIVQQDAVGLGASTPAGLQPPRARHLPWTYTSARSTRTRQPPSLTGCAATGATSPYMQAIVWVSSVQHAPLSSQANPACLLHAPLMPQIPRKTIAMAGEIFSLIDTDKSGMVVRRQWEGLNDKCARTSTQLPLDSCRQPAVSKVGEACHSSRGTWLRGAPELAGDNSYFSGASLQGHHYHQQGR